MTNLANQLHDAIEAVCPIEGIAIVNAADKSTWRIDFAAAATDAQKVAAQGIVAGFNGSLATLRARRDQLLAACDYTQLPDAPEADKAAWATYRQVLRDLPEGVVDPANPTWPVAPAA